MPDRRDGKAYVLSDKLRLAVQISQAAGRPLLLRGDPGSGKSSLAAHIARLENARYYEHVVTSQTQAQDLLWRFDTVRRLAEAQLGERRDDHAYVEPGVLWWAFARNSASRRGVDSEHNADRSPTNSVVLIDEIDKADPDVPNGLLIPLGTNQFKVTETGEEVDLEAGRHLVIVTTNEERELPQAFLRRCVVVWLEHPDADGMVEIARKHLETYDGAASENDLRLARELAVAVEELRREKTREAVRPTSTAEFLDALLACRKLGISTSGPEWEMLRQMALVKQQRPC
jgi:MoxR-like ATPase